MAPTCCGKIFVRFGTSFGISFLQTGASLKKAHGFDRGCVTFMGETTYTASSYLDFFTEARKTNRNVVLKFGIIPGSFGLFYTLIEFLGI
jgi:hypothetical protein